jgi:hypothetical protein
MAALPYVAVPVPTDQPASIVQSVLALKQNAQTAANVPRVTPVRSPTIVNIQLATAISRVTP